MFIVLLLLSTSLAQEVIYSDGIYNWKINDSALINYYEYVLDDGKKWIGGMMQQFDVLKFNGDENTTNFDLLCFNMQYNSSDEFVKLKVRLLPYNFRGDDESNSGLITRAYNKQETCVQLSSEEFPNQCKEETKYVSIQLYHQFEQKKTFVYFNNIMFKKDIVAVSDSNEYSLVSKEACSSLSILALLFAISTLLL
ncbi:hypothetical protein EIN_085260 [Entamoeba invadens IP1]|uniref:hypothetical protein n=1 Tax=Entamoeba invadens IP1 TaxID=370355 RepID=UPI0002C3D38B|nr:hypothetical protein EIN_085260 [Entamoeba invadens IP1]ELP85304.1 hypothetical protein EIN_085260 [Entamoeba invadens IP1]|eukprot:XP_004184650.1 hypothetical protein EIN_085260 [Entamoeba invadens IP1]